MDKFVKVDILEANATRVEDFGYPKYFNEEELESFKEDIAELSIEISDLEDEKKALVKEINDRIKKAKESRRESLTRFKNKSEFINEKCYVLTEAEQRKVGYYNQKGDLVHTRPTLPSEVQTIPGFMKIVDIKKTGTND